MSLSCDQLISLILCFFPAVRKCSRVRVWAQVWACLARPPLPARPPCISQHFPRIPRPHRQHCPANISMRITGAAFPADPPATPPATPPAADRTRRGRRRRGRRRTHTPNHFPLFSRTRGLHCLAYALFSCVGARGCESGHGSGHGSDAGVSCWPDLPRILIQIRASVFQLLLTKRRNVEFGRNVET